MSSLDRFDFLQPRHVYAPDEGDGHIYLSAPLSTLMARLHAAGLPLERMRFIDENFDSMRGQIEEARALGINLVGTPYIPEVIELLEGRVRQEARVILGGQVIDKLSPGEFQTLFDGRGPLVHKAGPAAKDFYGVDFIPSAEQVSSIPVWESIPDEAMRAYLGREISFYLSQGCMFQCSFCVAAKGQPERYRDMGLALKDLEWLARRAQSFGYDKLEIYLSNLDLFQTPRKFQDFLEGSAAISKVLGFPFRFRGLATVHSILKVSPDYLRSCREAGLHEVGIGIDGATPHVWKKTKKIQNLPRGEEREAQRCIESIQRVHAAGMIPEMLMVLGHDAGNIDATILDMTTAKSFVKEMRGAYRVKVHPYLVKNLLPGSEAWQEDENAGLVQRLLQNPQDFRDLDFAALPSDFSHPDRFLQATVRAYYLDFLRSIGQTHLESSGLSTSVVGGAMKIPDLKGVVRSFNLGNYDR